MPFSTITGDSWFERGTKVETNGGGGGGSPGSDARSAPVTPPESQSPLHFLADLGEQKSRGGVKNPSMSKWNNRLRTEEVA